MMGGYLIYWVFPALENSQLDAVSNLHPRIIFPPPLIITLFLTHITVPKRIMNTPKAQYVVTNDPDCLDAVPLVDVLGVAVAT